MWLQFAEPRNVIQCNNGVKRMEGGYSVSELQKFEFFGCLKSAKVFNTVEKMAQKLHWRNYKEMIMGHVVQIGTKSLPF